MNDAVEHANRACPACGATTVSLPLFTTRRRHPVTCTNCGVKLERVLPGVPYYTLSLIAGLLLEAAVGLTLFLALFQQWWKIAVVIGAVVAVNLGVSMFLNARTRVEFANVEDARRDKPGRWYPE